MANSRRLTAKLCHSSPDRAEDIRLRAIADGCEMKNGLAQPSRTAASHSSRMAANDMIPRTRGADFRPAMPFIFRSPTVFLPALARRRWLQIRTGKPAAHQKVDNRFGIPNHSA